MSVTSLSLKSFSAFREADFRFSPGLNVLIGANATGKSHAMKLIYSILKIKAAGVNGAFGEPPTPEITSIRLQEKLQRIFRPEDNRIGRLVTRGRGRNHAEVRLTWEDREDHRHCRIADEACRRRRADEHPDYRERIEKLDGTRAVDFLALHRDGSEILYWIEVKDFRGYRIENKKRMSDGELAHEVGTKIRDSLAGVMAAYCSSTRWGSPHLVSKLLLGNHRSMDACVPKLELGSEDGGRDGAWEQGKPGLRT